MSEQGSEKIKKHICIGLLAHVDAGKTTLAEGLLYTCGRIRKLGRVDHGDAFLDNFSLERERGITIFSKQARIAWDGLEMTLLDTPGHVDFSAEMERTLQVLDYALLVISGADGVQGHVQTLWRLLGQYGIPAFLFINKMDQPGTERAKLLKELQGKLDGGCQEFGPQAEGRGDSFWEEIALCDEKLMEEYLETERLQPASLAEAIARRRLFPCYFGSGLRLEGVEELLGGIRTFALCPEYPEVFGARVYKISRDPSGRRLTHLKVTGGVLRVKMPVSNRGSAASEKEVWEEKADQLRIYEGAQYSPVEQAEAGSICVVTGLDKTFAGQGLGAEGAGELPILAPVLTYGLELPEGSDAVKVLGQLRKLEEEEPQLHVVWREQTKEIHVQVMGEVQIEVLKRLISERFGLEVEFGDGQIVYKETIAGTAEGIGHYEPLRHYAEVHLLLEPGEPGSGMEFASACSGDVLDRNWQRLVLTHLEEKSHVGVLTGSPLTDMKITLLTGRAHLAHTEGGDFRQATYRAVRQGLMQCRSILLEPVFAFSLELPANLAGRAMSDVRRMHGSFDAPLTQGEYVTLTGSAPAATMQGYQKEVNAYAKGMGRLSCTLKGYEPCHNADEVIKQLGYDPEADLDNPSSSVFCAHGAGFLVRWDQVGEYAHLESGWSAEAQEDAGETGNSALPGGAYPAYAGWEDGRKNGGRRPGGQAPPVCGSAGEEGRNYITQEEIEEIFQRTYGKGKRDYEPYRYNRLNMAHMAGMEAASPEGQSESVDGTQHDGTPMDDATFQKNAGMKPAPRKEEYLLVDGYNIIFAWEDLRDLAERNIDGARDKLMDICSNYQGFTGCTLILVFDAYKVKGNPGSVLKYHNIYVVYTKEAETADQYIEKTVHGIGRKHHVTVATSDRLEQIIIWGEGAVRLSASGFRETVEAVSRQIREEYIEPDKKVRNRPFEKIIPQNPGNHKS